jgi:Phosphoadenosine phosphosulfate reductase family
MKYVLSYGAGLNSTALLVYLIKKKEPLDVVLFADTGDEFPATYETVNYYKQYAEDNKVKFEIVKSELSDSLYQYMYNKKIVPSRFRRDCTSKFKISPMRHYMRSTFGKQQKFIQYIGIDYSEAHRIMTNDVQYIENRYPLVDAKIDRQGCQNLLEQEGLLIPPKSGCYYCPFTTRKKWNILLDTNPELFNKAIELEQNATRHPHPNALLHTIPLIKLKDRKVGNTKLDNFIVLSEPSCDVSGSCFL